MHSIAGFNQAHDIRSLLIQNIHNTWLTPFFAQEPVSGLARNYIASTYMPNNILPSIDNISNKQIDIIKCYISNPFRMLEIAGCSVTWSLEDWSLKNINLSDEDLEYSQNLCSLFSMNTRFRFIGNANKTHLNAGMMLLLTCLSDCDTELIKCLKYVIDRAENIVEDSPMIGDIDTHKEALMLFWVDICEYIMAPSRHE